MFHVVNVSSNANNGAIAGTFNVNANNSSSNLNRNIGTQFAVSCYTQQTPARKGEYVDPMQFGRATEELGEHQQ